jgi:serine palmitoyltransferase
MLATAAIESLHLIDQQPSMLVQLRENCEKIQEKLKEISGVLIVGEGLSPIKHVRLAEPSTDRDFDVQTLQKVADLSRENKVAVTLARYLNEEEHKLPVPSIRISVNNSLSEDEIENVCTTLGDAFQKILVH